MLKKSLVRHQQLDITSVEIELHSFNFSQPSPAFKAKSFKTTASVISVRVREMLHL